MGKKTKRKETGNNQEDEEFTIDLVQQLGGTKADYEMLHGIDDSEKSFDPKAVEFDSEPINRDDIRSFMDDIGLGDLRRQKKIAEAEEKEKERELNPKKIRLAVMPGYIENDSDQESSQEEDKPKGRAARKLKKEKASKENSTIQDSEISKEKKATKDKSKIRDLEISQKEKPAKDKSKIRDSKILKKEKAIKDKSKIQDSEISSTTVIVKKPKKAVLGFLSTHRPRKHLLAAKQEGKWYDVEFPNDPATFDPGTTEDMERLEQFAARLMTEDVALYKKEEESHRKSDVMWMRTVLTSGTLQDKIAALIILTQDSPLHNMAALDTLVAMAKKKGRREALASIDTLKELFLSDLLPDRKLKAFDQHPLALVDELTSGNKDSRDRRLLLWYFEAQLKERYASFVKALEAMAHDTVTGPKQKAVGLISEMLSSKPEQEKSLLALLVNKLGDPDYKVASTTAHHLSKLVGMHPNMKFVVVLEVERLLYRPNVSNKAQYYAVCFLNQLVLRSKEVKLAARLITIYFSFFKLYVKRGEVDSKMLSALLMGVNRAYPYAKVEREKVTEQMDTLYRMVHIVAFNTSVQALMLLYHVVDTSDRSSERYYSALYRKLLDPALKLSSKQTMFLNLLFKSMRKDPSDRRVQAFTKRLLQVCCHQGAPFVCASLILISELVKQKKNVLRISKAAEDSDDEEEHFVDAPDEGPTVESNEVKVAMQPKGGPTTSSWVHRKNKREERTEYDPLGRNPQYCHAESECTWELQRLGNHFHPTVALWARNIMQGECVHYKSDPLKDFTLIRFLDRFVYRNPKKKNSSAGVVTARRRMSGRGLASVNTDEYLELGEKNIPADEKFFFRYFNQKAAVTQTKTAADHDSNASDVTDDEFDDYLDTFEKGLMEEGKRELDFAGELEKQKRKGKKKKTKDAEDSDVDDLSDEEVDFGDLGDEFEAVMNESDVEEDDGPGFNEEDVDFSDNGDEFGELTGKELKRAMEEDAEEQELQDGPPSKRGRKEVFKDQRANAGLDGLFAAADEFAHLMDENTGSGVDMIGSHAVSNKDKADVKQLKWEADRERWMRDAGHSRRAGAKKGGPGRGARGGSGPGGKSRVGKQIKRKK